MSVTSRGLCSLPWWRPNARVAASGSIKASSPLDSADMPKCPLRFSAVVLWLRHSAGKCCALYRHFSRQWGEGLQATKITDVVTRNRACHQPPARRLHLHLPKQRLALRKRFGGLNLPHCCFSPLLSAWSTGLGFGHGLQLVIKSDYPTKKSKQFSQEG